MANTFTTRLTENKMKARPIDLLNSTTFQLAALAAITLVAAIMRLYKLGVWSFWIDEVLELGYARDALRNFSLYTRPSLYLIGTALNALGTSEWSARLAPALVGILTVPLLYFPIKKLFGSLVALIAVLLLVLSPWHLHWSQNARFYTVLMLFYALGQLAFFFWMEENRPIYLVFAGLFLFLAFLERLVTLFIAPVILLYFAALLVFPFGRPAGFRWRNLLLMAVPAVLFVFYDLILRGGLSEFSFYIVGQQHEPLRVLLASIYDIGLPLFIIGLVGGVYLLLQRSRAGLFIFLGAVIPVVLLVLVAPFTQAFSRYVFITLPSWVILGAVATKEILTHTERHAKILALAVLLILVIDFASQDVLYYTYQNGNRQDWKGAFAIVEQEKSPGDWVISTRPEIGQYYLGEEVTWTQGLTPKKIVESGRRAWLVIDDRTGNISPRLESWFLHQTRLVGVRDVYIPGKPMTMRVYLYDPANP